MVEIKVQKSGQDTFYVTVAEGGGTSTYTVRLGQADYQRLTNGLVGPEELVKKSFEFLLEREPKESILSSFTIPNTINQYFPEFESVIGKKLS